MALPCEFRHAKSWHDACQVVASKFHVRQAKSFSILVPTSSGMPSRGMPSRHAKSWHAKSLKDSFQLDKQLF